VLSTPWGGEAERGMTTTQSLVRAGASCSLMERKRQYSFCWQGSAMVLSTRGDAR
jgi:hypothetical protein